MISVVIATHGSDEWKEAAWSFAYPSAFSQSPWVDEVIVHHEPDGTIASARNQAASRASGEFLCFLDADDRLGDCFGIEMAGPAHAAARPILNPPWTDGRTGRSWDQLNPASLLVPAVQYVEGGRCVGTPEIPSWGRPIGEINCAVIGTLVRKELFDIVGGFRELPIYEDWDLWLRCVREGAELVPVPDAVYCATRRGFGRNSGPHSIETYWRIRQEHEAALAAVR